MNKINRLAWKRFYKKDINPQLPAAMCAMFFGGFFLVAMTVHIDLLWFEIMAFSMVAIPLFSLLFFCINEALKQFRRHKKQVIKESKNE